jgi:hypothetical protein
MNHRKSNCSTNFTEKSFISNLEKICITTEMQIQAKADRRRDIISKQGVLFSILETTFQIL